MKTFQKIALCAGLVGVLAGSRLGHSEIKSPEFSTQINPAEIRSAVVPSVPQPQAAAVATKSRSRIPGHVKLGKRVRQASLPRCGGTIEFKPVDGQIQLAFRDVANCSRVRILSQVWLAPPLRQTENLKQNGQAWSGEYRVRDPKTLQMLHIFLRSEDGNTTDVIEINLRFVLFPGVST